MAVEFFVVELLNRKEDIKDIYMLLLNRSLHCIKCVYWGIFVYIYMYQYISQNY